MIIGFQENQLLLQRVRLLMIWAKHISLKIAGFFVTSYYEQQWKELHFVHKNIKFLRQKLYVGSTQTCAM
jgi:hypothetical protein